MTKGFQQQDPALNFNIPKSAPSPQHGQKADPAKTAPAHPARRVEPQPGH